MIITINDEPIEMMPESTVEEVIQNVRMILGIARGTVPIDRDFGLRTDLVDAPIGTVRALLTAYLTEDIPKFEPRAKLVSLEFRRSADGKVEPLVTVAVDERG